MTINGSANQQTTLSNELDKLVPNFTANDIEDGELKGTYLRNSLIW